MSKAGQAPPNKGRTFPPEPLMEAEVGALLRGCSLRAPTGIRNRALIAVMYRAGLRVSETLALRPADANLTDGTLRVHPPTATSPRRGWQPAWMLAAGRMATPSRRAHGLLAV
jgi:site-specific recombinase XerD